MDNLKQVNIFPGRFQPFHKGHLQCCEDAYKKNGLPVVIMYVSNNKFDKKKPFNDELIIEELEIIKNNYNFIEDFIPMTKPLIGQMCDSLKQHGYEANIWLAGPDRIDRYRHQLKLEYIDQLGVRLPELMETNRYCSATEVREIIKTCNKKKFEELMPKGTGKLFDKYKQQIDSIKEGLISLKDYILEHLEE